MDHSILRMLHTIKGVEAHLPERTEHLDLATFKPMYPNVIIVDQTKVDKVDLTQTIGIWDAEKGVGDINCYQFDTDKRETITNSLTRALALTDKMSETHWTIILKEGLYIDPRFEVDPRYRPITLEILGLKDARILLAHNARALPKFGHVHLTLRNIRLFDCRKKRPDAPVFDEWEGLDHDFCIGIGADIRMINCLVSGSEFMMGQGGQFSAENCHFIHVVGFKLMDENKAVFSGCHFDGGVSRRANAEDFSALFALRHGGTIVCDRSTILDYSAAFVAIGSKASVSFDRCLLSTTFVGGVEENANAKIFRCFINADDLIKLHFNPGQTVELKKNRLSPQTEPVFHLDQYSKEPSHDIQGAVVKLLKGIDSRKCSKEKSAYTKSFKREVMTMINEGQFPYGLTGGDGLYKLCELCFKREDAETLRNWRQGKKAIPKEKFRYCPCQAVCYCSKECQAKHWPDHRLSCAKQRSGKKSSSKK